MEEPEFQSSCCILGSFKYFWAFVALALGKRQRPIRERWSQNRFQKDVSVNRPQLSKMNVLLL